MSFVEAFDRAVKGGSTVVEYARKLLLDLIIPDKISKSVVESFFRKALRVGVWRLLRPEQRALILVLRVWGREVRSRKLVEVVRNVFLEIELSTLRGKALLYGIVITIKSRVELLKDLLRNIGYVLALGIMYLNNPPILRIYG